VAGENSGVASLKNYCSNDDDVTMFGDILEDRDMAIKFKPRGWPFAVWLPKSQLAIIQGIDGPEITMLVWLAERKNIL